MIACVSLSIPLDRAFDYAIPEAMCETIQQHARVVVPFGARQMVGFVTELRAKSELAELKSIRRLLDPTPLIDQERWELALWMSRHYACSLGEALALMVPQALRLKLKRDDPAQPSEPQHAPGKTKSPFALMAQQENALATIQKAIDSQSGETVLLHGVTGSGKTELYLRAIQTVVSRQRSAICLIPEIALTPQTVERFKERFGDASVVVWHSALSARQRSDAWQRLATGKSSIIVGARSAVFAPAKRLGLIILDEEHEPTYKQEDVPRYHAREVAQARAKLSQAAVILGSATPSVESFYLARQGAYRLATLSERVHGRPMPSVDIIDMRPSSGNRRASASFSIQLQLRLEQAFSRGEQVMLLLNRRGFARTAQCQSCSWTALCQACSIPLIYHADRKVLLCHYCGQNHPLTDDCPSCKKGYLRLKGSGTERVESEIHRLFPGNSVARMDSDSMTDAASYQQAYDAFKRHQVGLLVGTQMIAKGLDFPAVTLVGVISADTALSLPDFRAGERTFSLLTQVAGRAGRGDQPGRVLIQTYNPEHPAIVASARHDYLGFYSQEIATRERLRLPPYAHLLELTIRGAQHARVQAASEALAASLQAVIAGTPIELLGPAPHRIPKVRKTYRMCLLLKGPSMESLVKTAQNCLQSARRFQGLPVAINCDPQ